MSATVKEIMGYMEEIAPQKLAEDWDNVGLAVGDRESHVGKILLALDVIDPVIAEAIALKADMIITHHPMLLFQKINSITKDTPLGRRIFELISHNITAFSAHTNLDIVEGGINDILGTLAGLTDMEFLEETYEEALCKIVVFVPVDHVEAVRNALCSMGAGHVGGYSHCTFGAEGEGTFLPLAGATPFLGEVGKLERAREVRLETVVSKDMVETALGVMKKAHPYEEVAYDIYPVEQKGRREGIGRIGNLKEPMTFTEFATELKEKLGLDAIRLVGDKDKMVKRVGLCTGSGAEFISLAKKQGADVYLTGDLKYHEAQKAVELGLCVIDVTHYASEVIVVPVLERLLTQASKEKGWGVEVIVSKVNGQTFWTLS